MYATNKLKIIVVGGEAQVPSSGIYEWGKPEQGYWCTD